MPVTTPRDGSGHLIPCPSGRTRLFGVIGSPVQQVQAPALLNRAFAERGVDAILVAIEACQDNVATVLQGLKCVANLDGFLVTVPHKFAICRHLDQIGEAVGIAGSANAVRREPDGSWTGDNFDGQGFVAGLIAQSHDPRNRSVGLVGAGGAGAAIAAALLGHGVARLVVIDVDQERADRLVLRLASRWPGRVHTGSTSDLAEVDLAVNATPVGLNANDPLPFALELLRPDTVGADIIMKPAETRLLVTAAARGLRTHRGIHMLAEQVSLYCRFFGLPERASG